MNTLRIPLAGLAAAVAMFVWTAVAHMMLPLGSAGISQIPGEQAPIASLNTAIGPKTGLYMFPWVDPKNRDAMVEYDKKSKTMPSGMIVYRAAGDGTTMTGATLGWEFLKQLACCAICAFLLAEATALTHYAARVAFVGCVGVVAAITDNVSNFVWYGYPGAYIAAQVGTDWIAYIVAGLVLAAMIKPSNTKPPIT